MLPLQGKPASYANTVFDDYNLHRYHQPADEYNANWDLDGAVQQCRVVMRLGYGLAYSDIMPTYYSNDGGE